MNKEIRIEIPQGFEIQNFDIKTGKITFKEMKKEITERVKSLDDAVKELGEEHEYVKEYRQLISAGIKGHIISAQEVAILTSALNEGWTPDWSNSNEYKYYPYFKMKPFSFYCYSYCSSFAVSPTRLCYKSSELAEYAGKQFLDIYKNYMI